MIETVFSKSAYGSLKLAQNCGADKHSSASIGLVLSGRTNISPEELETLKADAELQAHRKWETSIPLGGNPADVYCIDVAWSMGDISDDEIGNNRKSVLEQAFFVWPNREDNEQYILETLRSAKTALHEILDRASRGEPVRIWYSHNPDEICGFYWLLAQLKKLPAIGSIYAVKLEISASATGGQTGIIKCLCYALETAPTRKRPLAYLSQRQTSERFGKYL